LNREEAYQLLTEYTKNPNLIKHALSVEAAMRACAKKFNEDEEKWGLVGLLHDFDYEVHPTLDKHPIEGSKILREKGYLQAFVLERGVERYFSENNNNVIIGISKSTKLGLLNQLSQILYTSKVIPSFIIIDKLVSNVFSDILGHLLLVRFSEDGHPHRVDMSSPDFEDNLSGIISNDIFYHGYPETLKVAHHLSVFTSSQSNSIKSYLVQKAGVLEIPSEDLRHVTLGSMSCIH